MIKCKDYPKGIRKMIKCEVNRQYPKEWSKKKHLPLDAAFKWSHTTQGLSYWMGISDYVRIKNGI